MFVTLTRKLAEVVNGIDISAYAEGDVIELSPSDAQLLIAERWAEPLAEGSETRARIWRPDARAIAADRRRPAKREDVTATGDPSSTT